MAPFASTEDVEALWVELDGADTELAQRLLEFGSAIIRNRYGDIDARITAGKLDGPLVRDILATMVRRAMSTTDAAVRADGSLNEPVVEGGPFTAMALTASEAALLASRTASSSIGSVGLKPALLPPMACPPWR